MRKTPVYGSTRERRGVVWGGGRGTDTIIFTPLPKSRLGTHSDSPSPNLM